MNAKKELLDHINGKIVRCASIYLGDEWDSNRKSIVLKEHHNQNDFDRFLESMDFEYYDGYGGQELFGIVWLANNEWLERGEYDGSEWWELKSYPNIPEELK